MATGDDVLDVIDEFGFGDGLVNTDELDAVRMAAEVVALRSVVAQALALVHACRLDLDEAETAVVRRAIEGGR